jgi:hypothetical protein
MGWQRLSQVCCRPWSRGAAQRVPHAGELQWAHGTRPFSMEASRGSQGQVRVGLPIVWAAAPRARRRKARPQAAAQRCEYRTVREERSGLGGAGMGATRDRPARLLAGDRVQRRAEGTPPR